MPEPQIADVKPVEVEFEATEELYWCACGKSSNQPYCDGSHAGSEFTPVAFEGTQGETAHLCTCKQTKNPPYCDGSHASLPDTSIEADTTATEPSDAMSDGMPIARPTPEEPHVKAIQDLARDGLSKVGHHGQMGAMGVPRTELPTWDDLQILTAQFAHKPLMDEAEVGTELIIGPGAKKPMTLSMPLFVSDVSLGGTVRRGKTLALQGSGDGGNRYLLRRRRDASGGTGSEQPLFLRACFGEIRIPGRPPHTRAGIPFQGRPGGEDRDRRTSAREHKVVGKIAQVRGLEEGQAAVSPPTFSDLSTVEDFAKALALGADGVALANSAMQAVGCVGARMCNTNNCPTGVATQKPELRARLDVAIGAKRLENYLNASTELLQVLARACGHNHLSQFNQNDITTWKKEMADLTDIDFAGYSPTRDPVSL
jgi:CDGSH-type Zn-finger protein